MTNETQNQEPAQQVVAAPIAPDTAIIPADAIGTLTPEMADNAKLVATQVESSIASINCTPEQADLEAAKAAVITTGNFHVAHIYNEKLDATHKKTAAAVVDILKTTERAANWTRAEIVEIWDRVEKEVKEIL